LGRDALYAPDEDNTAPLTAKLFGAAAIGESG